MKAALQLLISATDFTLRKLASFYFCPSYLTWYECQWICWTGGLSIVTRVNTPFCVTALVLCAEFALRDIAQVQRKFEW